MSEKEKKDSTQPAKEPTTEQKASTDLVLPSNFDELVEAKAKEIAHKYKEQSHEMKLFNEKKAQISFYLDQGALPTDKSIGQLMIMEQMGRQLGLSFLESMNGLGFINGKIAMYGEVLLSQLTKAGVKITFSASSSTSVTAVIEYQGKKGTTTQTLEEWKTKGVVPKPNDKGYHSSPWTKYPETMLRYKAVRHEAKFICPHLLGGLPIMEDEYEVKRLDQGKKEEETINAELDGIVEGFEK